MRRFVLYAVSLAAIALAIWLVAGTRESRDPLDLPTQASGTGSGVGESAESAGAAARRAAGDPRAPDAQEAAAADAREQAARAGSGAASGAGAGTSPEAQLEADNDSPESLARPPSNAPRVLRSLNEAPPEPEKTPDTSDARALLPIVGGDAPPVDPGGPAPTPTNESAGDGTPDPGTAGPPSDQPDSGAPSGLTPEQIHTIVTDELTNTPPGTILHGLPGVIGNIKGHNPGTPEDL